MYFWVLLRRKNVKCCIIGTWLNRAERKQLSYLIINPIKPSRIHGFLKINWLKNAIIWLFCLSCLSFFILFRNVSLSKSKDVIRNLQATFKVHPKEKFLFPSWTSVQCFETIYWWSFSLNNICLVVLLILMQGMNNLIGNQRWPIKGQMLR